jgi:hypothetical protein
VCAGKGARLGGLGGARVFVWVGGRVLRGASVEEGRVGMGGV